MLEESNEGLQEVNEEDELSLALEGKIDENTGDKDEDEKVTAEGEEGKEETEEVKEEVGEKAEGEKAIKEPDAIELLQGEVKDLRQMVRTSKRELTIAQAKLERLGDSSAKTKSRDEDEDDEDDENKREEKKESLSTVEDLQQKIVRIGATRGAALDVLLEAMEQNPKYSDIKEVCSRENFDDIFDAMATEVTKNGTGNFDETLLEAELSIWNKANPYKYMYDIIKKYHPSYTKKETVAGPKDKNKDITKVKVPGTIADKSGDSNLKSGWTAKRIDDLPEDELHTVPKEIYTMYMKDELG